MYIVFDIGATHMRFASSDDLLQFDKPVIVDTPQKFDEAMDKIYDIVAELAEHTEIVGIAGGVAGVLDSKKTTLNRAPNIPDWEGKPLRSRLMDATGVIPHIYNDADMAGLGEAAYGAGKGRSIIMYITVSTGLGGGLIVDKQIAPHHIGFEPGFQIIDHETKETLHDFIAGHDLEAAHGKPAKDINDPKVWECIFDKLTIGLHNSIIHWSPEIVVIGGSMIHRFKIEDVSKRVNELMTIFTEVPEFALAELGDHNGLYGALAHLQSAVQSYPQNS